MKSSSVSFKPASLSAIIGKKARQNAPTKDPSAVLIHNTSEYFNGRVPVFHPYGYIWCSNMLMIIVFTEKINTVSQEIYDRVIDNIYFCSVKCTCGHSGCLIKHAYYCRRLRFRSCTVVLSVLRVKCKQCGRTHTVLLSCMVPYSQIPLEDQIKIVQDYESGSDIMSVLETNYLIDPREVYYIVHNYCKHWKQRLLSENISDFSNIVTDCFRLFQRQFMQIHRGKQTLFCLPT